MHTYNSWQGLKKKHPQLFVGLGNFDGVHLGHQSLIRALVKAARAAGAAAAVLTFHPHPLAVIKPEAAPPLLLVPEAKKRLIASLGVDVLLEVPFTPDFARLTPEEFVQQVLVTELGVRGVFVGYNYTFGAGGRGTADMLVEWGEKYGFAVTVIPPVTVGEQVVSSTLIRQLLRDGDVESAAVLLGYPFFVQGPVVTGECRGRQIGFPTANVAVPTQVILPANGVYAVQLMVEGRTYRGVANIGVKPTFHGLNGRRPVLEVHILDFTGDLYGYTVEVTFLRRLREERRFSSVEELVRQINSDIAVARRFLA